MAKFILSLVDDGEGRFVVVLGHVLDDLGRGVLIDDGGHWWNVLASLPRHLTFKAQVSWELPGSPSRSPSATKAILTHPNTGILHWRNQEGQKTSHLYF